MFYRLNSTVDAIIPTESEVESKVLELKYSSVYDHYVRVSDDETVVSDWYKLVHEAQSVFLKVEHDWKTNYLCRKEGTNFGKVVWLFEVGSGRNVCIGRVEILVSSTCFENGHVKWTLTNNQNRSEVIKNSDRISLNCLAKLATFFSTLNIKEHAPRSTNLSTRSI